LGVDPESPTRLGPREASKLASLAFAVKEKREPGDVVLGRLRLTGFAQDVGRALIGEAAASDEVDQTARSIAAWARDL
jgi:hypothetical protein